MLILVTMNELWNQILIQLSGQLSETAMKTWFSDCQFVALENDSLVVSAPGPFVKDVIDKRFAEKITAAANDLLGTDAIKLTVLPSHDDGAEYVAKKQFNAGRRMPKMEDFLFENFVIGRANEFACKAALKVAHGPSDTLYNPLFIYSDSGMGKTHLLCAIGQEAQRLHPEMNIVYVKGVDFLNKMIEAIKNKKTDAFREEFRSADMLLVDDVHIIAGKRATQEEFFHTFNEIYEAGHQLVITSDRPPKDFTDLEERLRSRFESGILVEIEHPDMQLRRDIAVSKCKAIGLELAEEDVDFIAASLAGNIRQLEGAIKSIAAYKDISGSADRSIVAMAVDNIARQYGNKLTADRIINETARYYSVTPEDIKGKSREQKYVRARQTAVYLMRENLDITLIEIGKSVNRTHATVLSGLKAVEDQLGEPETKKAIEDIKVNLM